MRDRIECNGAGENLLEMPEGSHVSDVFFALGLEFDAVRVIMKNGRALQSDEALSDGDRLGMFPRELAFNTMTAISFFNPLARKEKAGES